MFSSIIEVQIEFLLSIDILYNLKIAEKETKLESTLKSAN